MNTAATYQTSTSPPRIVSTGTTLSRMRLKASLPGFASSRRPDGQSP
jgi:hypothetical protein